MTRIAYIDIAKSLALICVILSHSVGNAYTSFSYGFMIPSFFILSGVTIKNISILQKAKRLLVPYVIFNIFILLLTTFSGQRTVTLTHWIGVIYSRFSLYPLSETQNTIWMNVGNSPTWFLTAMFMSFIFLKGILFFQKESIRLSICTLYLIVTILLTNLKILLPWSIDSAMLFALFMYAGTKLKIFFSNRVFLNKTTFFIGSVIYGIGYYLNTYINLSIRDYGEGVLLVLINGIVGSLLLIRLSMHINKSCMCNILTNLNKGAITTFCIQMPLLIISSKIAFLIIPNNVLFATLFQVVFTLIIGLYIAKFVNPILKWFYNL